MEVGEAIPAPVAGPSTAEQAVPALIKIVSRYRRPAYSSTRKGRGEKTPCIMCALPQARRAMNDIAHSHRKAKPNNLARMPVCDCLQDLDVQYPAPRDSAYKHTNVAHFGIALLWRYPEVLDSAGKFRHDQIRGYALQDLNAWWAEQGDLQEARENGNLKAAVRAAAAAPEIEAALAPRVPADL